MLYRLCSVCSLEIDGTYVYMYWMLPFSLCLCVGERNVIQSASQALVLLESLFSTWPLNLSAHQKNRLTRSINSGTETQLMQTASVLFNSDTSSLWEFKKYHLMAGTWQASWTCEWTQYQQHKWVHVYLIGFFAFSLIFLFLHISDR